MAIGGVACVLLMLIPFAPGRSDEILDRPLKFGATMDSFYDFMALENGQFIEVSGVGRQIYHYFWFNPMFDVGCSSDRQSDWDLALYGPKEIVDDRIYKIAPKGSPLFLRLKGLYYDRSAGSLPDGRRIPPLPVAVLYIRELEEARPLSDAEYQRMVKEAPCSARSSKLGE
jgi:hypothetical protein